MPENNENILEAYKRKNAVKNKCLNNKTSYFVEYGESSTTVHNTRTDEDITVNIVLNEAEGPDSAYVYSLKSTDLAVSDCITWKSDVHFIIYEDMRIIKEVDFNKFRAYECNVLVNNSIYGYFLGSVKSAKDIQLKSGFEVSKLLPTLVLPQSSGINIDDQITINNQVWDVVEADLISNPLIGYYYIERGTNTMASVQKMPKDKSGVAYSGTTLTVATEDGYYRSDVKIELISRTSKAITFRVPNENFVIYTRSNGAEKANSYIVKESL